MKPQAECWLGQFIRYSEEHLLISEENILETHSSSLKQLYNHLKIKYECDLVDHELKFCEYEIIVKPPLFSCPLSQYGTVGIKFKVIGRAYKIKRFKSVPLAKKRHSNAKYVPKHKRGKPILKRSNGSLDPFK